MKTTILGLKLENRTEVATSLQDILTKYGCSIRSRIGLHDNEEQQDDDHGIILLELTGDPKEQKNLEEALTKLEKVQVQRMAFE